MTVPLSTKFYTCVELRLKFCRLHKFLLIAAYQKVKYLFVFRPVNQFHFLLCCILLESFSYY